MEREVPRCPYCGYVISRNSWLSNEEIEPGKFKTIFWCVGCQKEFTVFAKREAARSWTSDGYILVKIPGIGWVKEHKYIWEKANGTLPVGSVIHHINGEKDDNRIENLIAIPKKSHSCYLGNTNQKNGLPSFPPPVKRSPGVF